MSKTTFLVSPGPAITLDTGAPAGAGDEVKVDPIIEHNARYIRDGRLVAIADTNLPTKAELDKRAKDLDIKGRSTMTADELAEAIATAEKENA